MNPPKDQIFYCNGQLADPLKKDVGKTRATLKFNHWYLCHQWLFPSYGPQQDIFYSGCHPEVRQILRASRWRAGWSTNTIYRNMEERESAILRRFCPFTLLFRPAPVLLLLYFERRLLPTRSLVSTRAHRELSAVNIWRDAPYFVTCTGWDLQVSLA